MTEHPQTEAVFVPASRAETASIPTNFAKPRRSFGAGFWAGIITGGLLLLVNGILIWMAFALR